MRTRQVALLALSAMIGVAAACFADATTFDKGQSNRDQQAPKSMPKSNNNQRTMDQSPTDSSNQSLDDQNAPHDVNAESSSSAYPFGEPKIVQQGAKWSATLPAKDFTIKSDWNEKPEFNWQFGPDKKASGAVSLTTVKLPSSQDEPPLLYALIYIYDPKAASLDMGNPDSIIDQLITTPLKEAEKNGIKVDIKDMEGRSKNMAGVVKDIRRQVMIYKEDKMAQKEMGLESHFYRVLVGKDFVLLGLVIGPSQNPSADKSASKDQELNKDAASFFDSITLEPKK